MAVLLLADGRLQRHGLLGDLQYLADLVHGHIHLGADLLGAGVVAQLLQQLAGHTDDLVDGLHHVDGDADGTRLIGDGAGDGLTDPPGSVGGELIALGVVELLHGLDQAQIALLDQVQEQHTAAHIALGDGHHQTQIGLGQLLLGLLAGLDLLFQLDHLRLRDGLAVRLGLRHTRLGLAAGGHNGGQLHLLIGGQQGHLADLLQVHTHGIVNVEAVHQRVGVDQLLLLDLGDLIHSGLAILIGQVGQEILAAYLDAQLLQRVVDGVHLLALQVQLVQHVGQLTGIQLALLLTLGKQVAQLLVAVQQRGRRQGRDGLFVQAALGGLLLRRRGLLQKLVRHLLQLLRGVLFFGHVRFPP